MSSALWTMPKTWKQLETISHSDLNANFNAILANFSPDKMGGYSDSIAQQQSELSPVTLATSMAEEIQQLRFVIRRILGLSNWTLAPGTDLTSIQQQLNLTLTLPRNRVESGRVDANSQPMFLVPGGTNSVRLEGAPTNLRVYINNVLVTQAADITLGALSGPASYTLAVNDATLAGGAASKLRGENGTVIPVDTGSGTAPTAGSYQAFKIVHSGNTEYFYGRFDSASQISDVRRGYFFDASDAAIPRIEIYDNDVITLCRTGYFFYTNTAGTGGLVVTYNRPTISFDQPASASSGDFWLDPVANYWKRYDGTSWVQSNGVFVGIAILDGANVVGARSIDFELRFSSRNTISLVRQSNTEVFGSELDQSVSVYGTQTVWTKDFPKWDTTADFDTGVTETFNTTYFLYLTPLGDEVISDVAPYDRRGDLLGFYHPSKPWRCVGTFYNNASSDIAGVTDQVEIKATRVSGLLTLRSASSGGGGGIINSTSYQDVTNLTVTGVFTGRPVQIDLIPAGSLPSLFLGTAGSAGVQVAFKVVRDSADVSRIDCGITNLTSGQSFYFPPNLMFEDTPLPGVHTYKLQGKMETANSGTAQLSNFKLRVRELPA